MKKEKYKYSISFIFGIILIVFSLGLLSYNYIEQKKLDAFEEKNIALLESEIPRDVTTDEEDGGISDDDPVDEPIEEPGNNEQPENPEPPVTVVPPIDYSKYYVGILEIPKINLKKGFLDIDSPYNNVDKNVTVIRTSEYPDVEKGNFILAAHTGNRSTSFFTKLHDLVIGDLAYINYKEKKYTYQLVDIYTQPKTGNISIYRNIEKTTLTLVTCTKGTQETQTIFILELISVE